MGGLSIRYSLRLEELASVLVAELASRPLAPHREETIVVQSGGMRQWLQLELARRLPVAAGLALPFPAHFFGRLSDLLLEAAGPREPFAALTGEGAFGRERLTWRILALLPELEETEYAPLRAYLARDREGRLALQLAERIAGRFDDYQVYRPDLLRRWQQEEEAAREQDSLLPHEKWQRRLWLRLRARAPAGEEPLAERLDRLERLLATEEGGGRLRHRLPRLSLFGITTLPPRFLDLLRGLARHIPVTLYATTPSTAYWGHIRSRREQAALAAGPTEEEDLHLEEGNPLLASLGRVGRDFFNLLCDLDGTGQALEPVGEEAPFPDTALGRLQEDIAGLRDRRPQAGGAPAPLDPGDRSLQVHACHSPAREMECLRDLLLEALGGMEGLRPADILVLVPHIERYAPFIQAVFALPREGLPAIPFHLADRSRRSEEDPVRALLRLLAMASGRYTVPEVFDLLQHPCLRRRFDLEETDLPLLQHLVREAGTSWGLDGKDREERFRVAPFAEGSWSQGLDRLLLGAAMGGREEPAAGILPVGGDTAGRNELVGRFVRFCREILGLLREMNRPRPAAAWEELLAGLLERFFRPGDPAEEESLADLLAQVARFGEDTRAAGLERPLTLVQVREHFARRFDEAATGRGHLDGRVTFAALKPMRSLPFRLICLAGLGEEDFPRPDAPLAFDLVAARGRPGDRTLRGDDRLLFLETILSARERLILLYPGRSPRDNAPRPPSSCLAELLEYCDRAWTVPGNRSPREVLVREHRLHPTSAVYYGGKDPRLFSHSRENCRAAAQPAAAGPAPFCPLPPGAKIADPPPPGEAIALADLVAFWRDPAGHFCRRVLRMELRPAEEEAPESEPFALNALERYQLMDDLVRRLYRPDPAGPETELARCRLAGRLPVGPAGEEAFHAGYARARELVARVRRHAGGEPRPAAVEVTVLGRPLRGEVAGMAPGGHIRHRPGKKLKARDLLAGWIEHLALNLARLEGGEPGLPTILVGLEEEKGFPAPGEAAPLRAALTGLVRGYLVGSGRPLPFFPESSRAIHGKKFPADLEAAAGTAWRGGSHPGSSPEGKEEAVALCFRGRNPLAEPRLAHRVRLWARVVWSPLANALEEGAP